MTSILNSLSNPEHIQTLSYEELTQLASECRKRIVEVTSKCGGHLASSLGTVELTVALFHVFNFKIDQIIWDVGHQAYTHKLLTNRNKEFQSLGKKGGIRKYLSPFESPYDYFGAGHASTSISAALGMAVARDLLEKEYNTIAVIGDGALTGGLAFEGLNHNGYLDKNMIVIYNDNGMSIDPNVGGISKLITRLSASKSYNRFRTETWELSGKIPFSESIRAGLHKINVSFKSLLAPDLLFEHLGWRYFGPIDGHNIEDLVDILSHVKELNGPVVIHLLTNKGKGYSYAEEDADKYHGVSPFVPESGEFIKKTNESTDDLSYSELYGQKLGELMERDPLVVGLSAAMMTGTGIISLQNKFPDRIFDVGIAEGHAVTFSAGMAASGLKPFVAIYSTFMQRAIDNIIHDVALQKLPVRFMMDRAGLVGDDGPTHHGVFDLSYLRMIPNMVIMAPKNGQEFRDMIEFCYNYNEGPSAVRYPKATGNWLKQEICLPIKLGKAEILKEGKEIAIFAIGVMVKIAYEVRNTLEERGYSVALVNARFAKPIDAETVMAYAQKVQLIVTMEENVAIGGFGSGILELLNKNNKKVLVHLLGISDRFIEHASQDEQREDCGISHDQAVKSILQKWDILHKK